MIDTTAKLQIEESILASTRIYSLHRGKYIGEQVFVKIFYQKFIEEEMNIECLEYCEEVLVTSPTFSFPQYFLPIKKVHAHTDGFLLLIDPYECRLDQFIKKRKQLSEEEAMKIFQQIFKSVYSLYLAGYWHRQIRAQHFVKVKDTWKMESLVFDNQPVKRGLKCEYTYYQQLAVPESEDDTHRQVTDEQIDQRIVWDLGLLLLQLLFGNRVAKANGVIFSDLKENGYQSGIFTKLQGTKISPDTEKLLQKMCSPKKEERMKIQSLIETESFSKEVAAHYKGRNTRRESKIFIRNKSQISRTLNQKKNENSKNIYDSSTIYKKYQQHLKILPKVDEQIQSEMKKQSEQKKVLNPEVDIKEQKNIMITHYDDVQMTGEGQEVLNFFKKGISKSMLLQQTKRTLHKISINSWKNKIIAAQYALALISWMQLTILQDQLQTEAYIGDYSLNAHQQFHKSKAKNQISKIIQEKLEQAFQSFKSIKNQGINLNQPLIQELRLVKEQSYSFNLVKRPYRKLLKYVYDIVTNKYTEQRARKWAQIGLLLTFCISIDKLFLPKYFEENFSFYFEWSSSDKKSYIPLKDLMNFTQSVFKGTLVQFSRQLIIRFFII